MALMGAYMLKFSQRAELDFIEGVYCLASFMLT